MSYARAWLSFLLSLPLALVNLGCGSSSPSATPRNDGGGIDDARAAHDAVADARSHDAPRPSDGRTSADSSPLRDGGTLPDSGGPGSLPFHCAFSTSPTPPNPCPVVTGAAGMVSFCYRSQWVGATSVSVYGGFGQATDWTDPFLVLKNDGTGTFTGTTTLASGSYPYVFKAQGSADNLVTGDHVFLDQENPAVMPSPAGAPDKRSVSVVTVPQPSASAIVHIKGTVLYKGIPQSCYSIDLEAGENDLAGKVVSEHDTANFTESASDGTFDFPVAVGAPYGVVVRFPFLLSGADAGYPNPSTTPSVGTARTGDLVTPTADLTLDPIDMSFSEADYAAMSPTDGMATLPVTFTFPIIAGATGGGYAAVISTDIAGNDPAYASPVGTATSVMWNGAFGGMGGNVVDGTRYYWGAWERRNPLEDGGTTWTEESLLFPITFH